MSSRRHRYKGKPGPVLWTGARSACGMETWPLLHRIRGRQSPSWRKSPIRIPRPVRTAGKHKARLAVWRAERRFEAAEVTGGKGKCLHESRWTKRRHMVDLGEGARGAVECSGGQQWSTGRNSTFNGAIMMQFRALSGGRHAKRVGVFGQRRGSHGTARYRPGMWLGASGAGISGPTSGRSGHGASFYPSSGNVKRGWHVERLCRPRGRENL